MAGECQGLLQALEGVFAECAVVADPLDIQETSVGFEADLAQRWKVDEPPTDGETAQVLLGDIILALRWLFRKLTTSIRWRLTNRSIAPTNAALFGATAAVDANFWPRCPRRYHTTPPILCNCGT
ncbi:MAG: hypothetical protein ACHBNF_19420 [Chromatiales bacterium]